MAKNAVSAACPRLWDSAFIDRDGEVYACCHYLPASIGNINESSLEDLRHGAAATRRRVEALAGGTACFDGCSILTAEEKQDAMSLGSSAPRDLQRLHVLFGEGCGLACIMCHQDHRSSQMLAADLVLERAPLSAGVSVEVQGGEPLQLKQSRRYLAALIDRGVRPTIITNGLYLRGELGELAVRGCARIKISINAASEATHHAVNRGSSWSRLISNLVEAVRVRDTLDGAAVLTGRMTIVPENLEEVAQFIELCADLRLNGVEYGYDARALPAVLVKDPGRLARLRDAVLQAHAQFSQKLRIQTHRLQRLGLWAAA